MNFRRVHDQQGNWKKNNVELSLLIFVVCLLNVKLSFIAVYIPIPVPQISWINPILQVDGVWLRNHIIIANVSFAVRMCYIEWTVHVSVFM